MLYKSSAAYSIRGIFWVSFPHHKSYVCVKRADDLGYGSSKYNVVVPEKDMVLEYMVPVDFEDFFQEFDFTEEELESALRRECIPYEEEY